VFDVWIDIGALYLQRYNRGWWNAQRSVWWPKAVCQLLSSSTIFVLHYFFYVLSSLHSFA